MSTERLIVVEQVNDPIAITGSFGLSGRIETLGSSVPSEDANVVGVVVEAERMPVDIWRALTAEATSADEDWDSELAEETAVELNKRVAVDPGFAFGMKVGIVTGQKLQT